MPKNVNLDFAIFSVNCKNVDKLGITIFWCIIARMENRPESRYPYPFEGHPELSERVRKSVLYLFGGDLSPEDVRVCNRIVQNARTVFAESFAKTCKTGAMLAITQRDPKTPILVIQIGEINAPDPNITGGKRPKYAAYAIDKAKFLQLHPELSLSSDNGKLPKEARMLTKIDGKEVPGGAVAEGKWIIAISGISSDPNEDTEAVNRIIALCNLAI